jgi:hypothetical protein
MYAPAKQFLNEEAVSIIENEYGDIDAEGHAHNLHLFMCDVIIYKSTKHTKCKNERSCTRRY